MEILPLLDIWFPPAKELAFLDAMRKVCATPWSPRDSNPFGKPPDKGAWYFDFCGLSPLPASVVCLHRIKAGHIQCTNITPNEPVRQLTREQYCEILNRFDQFIAGPAAAAVEGTSAMGAAEERLEDHLPDNLVSLLYRFCSSSNQTDLGTHLSDQERWMDFLIASHKQKIWLHCDVFKELLRSKNWWPEVGIRRLGSEYDFAERLLTQYDGK